MNRVDNIDGRGGSFFHVPVSIALCERGEKTVERLIQLNGEKQMRTERRIPQGGRGSTLIKFAGRAIKEGKTRYCTSAAGANEERGFAYYDYFDGLPGPRSSGPIRADNITIKKRESAYKKGIALPPCAAEKIDSVDSSSSSSSLLARVVMKRPDANKTRRERIRARKRAREREIRRVRG